MLLKIPKTEFVGSLNLRVTLDSDQCPSDIWHFKNGKYTTFIRTSNYWKPCLIWEDQTNLFVKFEKDITQEILYHFWSDYNLLDFYQKFGEDKYISEIIDYCKGLRLMRDLDITYRIIEAILTQNSSVRQIRSMDNKLRKFYGNGYTYNLEKIANANEKELQQKCGVGYRAKYIINLAKNLLDGTLDVEVINQMNTKRARNLLMEFDGIGPKVADIILLYGFGKSDAFPMDTWLRRALIREYFKGNQITDRKLRKFALDYFGEYAGIAHLYMFYYERKIFPSHRTKSNN